LNNTFIQEYSLIKKKRGVDKMEEKVFKKILIATDGSENAMHAELPME
jgi:hypothetical protein